MRCASKSNLMQGLRVSAEKAEHVRKLSALADQPEELQSYIETHLPGTFKYPKSLHGHPDVSDLNRGWRTTIVLHGMDEAVGGYGVEALGPQGASWPPHEYVNMGDAYATTLIYTRKTDTVSVGDWGSIAERHPSW